MRYVSVELIVERPHREHDEQSRRLTKPWAKAGCRVVSYYLCEFPIVSRRRNVPHLIIL